MIPHRYDLSDITEASASASALAQSTVATMVGEARSYRTSAEHPCQRECTCVGMAVFGDIHSLTEGEAKRALRVAVAHLAARGGLGGTP